jgi:hypothetical protein
VTPTTEVGLSRPRWCSWRYFSAKKGHLRATAFGGAEIVANEVKGNLAPDRGVAILRGDQVYRDEGVQTSSDSCVKLVLRDNTVVTVGASTHVKLTVSCTRARGNAARSR